MRKYGKISPKFWTGITGKEIKKSGPESMLVAAYLITSPHADMLGLYHLPISYISHDTGIPFKGASKGLRRCIEVGFCAYDDDSEVVWVYEMAKFQISDLLKPDDNRVKAATKAFLSAPKCSYLFDFYSMYKDLFHLPLVDELPEYIRGLEAPSKPLGKPLRSQEQEQEQEQEHDQEHENDQDQEQKHEQEQDKDNPNPKPKIKKNTDKFFDEFWKVYPRKDAPKPCREKWIKGNLDEIGELIIHDVINRKKSHTDWLDGYVHKPSTYLNQRLWEGEIFTKPNKDELKKRESDRVMSELNKIYGIKNQDEEIIIEGERL